MFLSASLVIGTAVFASLPVKVEAGPGFSVCFPTCVAVCVGGATAATATIGAVAAAGPCMEACMTACFSTCFSDKTTVFVKEGDQYLNRNISQVKSGDLVLTSKDNENYGTKVLRNIKTEGNFEFVQITAQNPYNTSYIQKIQVTPEHGLVLRHKDSPMTIDTAAHIQLGDTLHGSNGDTLSVIDISRTILDTKYTLETCDGTVLASDFHVTTVCNEVVAGGEHLFESVMGEWQVNHSSLC